MLVPVLLLVLSIFALLLITGQGNLASGDGGTAVFVSGLFTLLVTGVWYRVRRITTVSTYTMWCVDGMKKMFDLVLILVLAYAFGHLLSTLGTASFLAQYAQMVPKSLMLVVGYLTATLIAYATGTSGGTAAVLVPVLVPVFGTTGDSGPLCAGSHYFRSRIWRSEFPNFRQCDFDVQYDGGSPDGSCENANALCTGSLGHRTAGIHVAGLYLCIKKEEER